MEKVSSKMCMLKDVGLNNNLFGGNMLSWMDEVAAIYAHEKTKEDHLVTFKFDEIVFKKPVKIGEIVEFYCFEPKIGKSSISFKIKAMVENSEVFSTSCVFVAVDENGKKKSIKNEN